ncbi:Developmentally-regulated GTP-binding protein 1 [Fukomys damarensis]|uniref:Developmentally-regulated GTP-binding protein 1 n=1 Tax=Fukomys damarensis TaxID=885580 RepID=A0A091CY62_FUKDA|nr:Developmentally-regulated GTP-binding protein 1 [Fukomys damarensis]
MSSTLAKIAEIEAEMARTQKNKATAHHLGLLKARLAKLRRELITPKGGGGGGPGEGFDVAKTGDARIGFVGFPSVGKSTLLSNLAGVYSEVAAYEFTTLTTVPGVIRYKGAKIQTLGAFLGAGIIFGLYYDAIWSFANNELIVLGPNGTPGFCATCHSGHLDMVSGFFNQFIGTTSLIVCVLAIIDPYNYPVTCGLEAFPVDLMVLVIDTSMAFSSGYTANPAPGTLLLDLPGIIEGAKDGKGRGRQVIAVARTCNLILIVLDVLKPLGHKKIIENELEGFGIRLNSKPPNIGFKKKDKGGINLTATCPQSELDAETVKSILAEYKIHNADVTLRSDATADDLIDVVEGNRVYIPCIYVLNKIDQISIEELDIIYKVPHCVPISAHHRWNFDDLLEKIWDYLKLVRIYTKPKGQLPDYTSPVVLPYSRTTVEDFCMKIHKNLIKEFKYALVWGLSVKHNPQKVGKDHTLEDEDVIQIVKK